MDEKDTYKYIQHRLAVANYKGLIPFTPNALYLIWKYSDGVPRTINVICDNALLAAYAMQQKKINADMVNEIAEDLRLNSSLADIKSRVIKFDRNKKKVS
jgi:general secretion pathway protein A